MKTWKKALILSCICAGILVSPVIARFMNDQQITSTSNNLSLDFVNSSGVLVMTVRDPFPPSIIKPSYLQNPYDENGDPSQLAFYFSEHESITRIDDVCDIITSSTGLQLVENSLLVFTNANIKFTHAWSIGGIPHDDMNLVSPVFCRFTYANEYDYLMIMNSSVIDFTIAMNFFTVMTYE